MTTDPRLISLVDRYLELRRQGQTPDLAELCADAPELLRAAEDKVRMLKSVAVAPRPLVTPVAPPGYELQDEIGHGGMGRVFRAYHAALDREVAIKFLHEKYILGTSLADAAGRKFLEEAKIAAKLQHPGIPAVHEVGTLPDGRPFLAMKLIRGKTLSDLLKEQGHGSAKWLGVFEAVCQSMGAAHALGYIHRDLKPANIMVGAFGEVQVMDWGIAKHVGRPRSGGVMADELSPLPTADDTVDVVPAEAGDDTDATRAGDVKGTLLYMPPEQARGELDKIDRRADVFALGAILCELLTGQTPLTGTKSQILNDLVTEQFDAALARLDGCGEDAALIALAKRCIAAKPESRPADASELAAAVAQFRAESEARAKRAEVERNKVEVQITEQRKRRWISRAAVAFLTLGIVGTSVGLALAYIAKESEKNRADSEQKAKNEAEESRDDLWDGLDVMTANIVEDTLGTQKAVSDEQKKFLDTVRPLYRKLADKTGNDEKTRVRVAAAAGRLGVIESHLGRNEASIDAFRQAHEQFEKLATEYPSVPEHIQNLAACHSNLGSVLRQLGKHAEGEEQTRKGLALREKLAADHPAVPKYRSDLANSHNSLGLHLRELGKRVEGEEQIRKGLALREKLAADHPAVPKYRSDVANSQINLGNLLDDLGKRAEGEEQIRKGLAGREKLVSEYPSVPEYRSALAACHNNLGNLYRHLGKGVEAEKQFRRGLVVGGELVIDYPSVPVYRADLARTHVNLGDLFDDLGKRAEGEEQIRKGLALQEQLVVDSPAVPAYRSALAASHGLLGILLAGRGQGREAVGELKKGLALFHKLAADSPAVPAYRSDLARSHDNLGLLLSELGQRVEGEEQIRKGLALREQLAADYPAVPEYRMEFLASCLHLGHSLRDGGKAADSLEWFDKAVSTLGQLHKADPSDMTAKQFLRESHGGRAEAYDQLQKYADAVKDWDRAIELSPKEDRPQFRAYRATSKTNSGQVAEAVAEVAELRKLPGWNAVQLYDFACVYSVASAKIPCEKQNYADQAMELLSKAVKTGFKDAAKLKADKALDPLRDRDDFKERLAEVYKK